MILGFTGTRKGMTLDQRTTLPSVLTTLPDLFLHGGAEGADTDLHEYLRSLNTFTAEQLGQVETIEQVFDRQWMVERLHIKWYKEEIYPASTKSYRRWYYQKSVNPFIVKVHVPMEPLDRNQLIAVRCDRLLAVPAEPLEQLRSGTWATVRYARTAGKPITFIMPDGRVTEEMR